MKWAVISTSVDTQGSGTLELSSALLSLWFDALLPQWGRGLCFLQFFTVTFYFTWLSSVGLLAVHGKSPAAHVMGNPVEWVFKKSSHTIPCPSHCNCQAISLLNNSVFGFHLLGWLVLRDLLTNQGWAWGHELFCIPVEGKMQQKWAGLENPWQVVKGLNIFLVGFFGFWVFFPSNVSLITGSEGESEGSSRVGSWGDNRVILLCHHAQCGHRVLLGAEELLK